MSKVWLVFPGQKRYFHLCCVHWGHMFLETLSFLIDQQLQDPHYKTKDTQQDLEWVLWSAVSAKTLPSASVTCWTCK